ncbi:unnamed protein product [Soboliphyme baturini]|uniref:DCB domain-containing protein n=1 Tax=Soboliphyme baturini TaxID=241478 RepID=A0A183IW75_9BILA|nr:unnamed protein product [Soboliphyme baturini]
MKESLLNVLRPCLDDLEKKANVLQQKCLAKHNPAAVFVAQPLFVDQSQNMEYSSAIDEILNDRTEQTYQQKALDALEGLREFSTNESLCSSEKQERIKNCLIDVFGAVARPNAQSNVLLRAMEAEKQYDEHCAQHRACNDK